MNSTARSPYGLMLMATLFAFGFLGGWAAPAHAQEPEVNLMVRKGFTGNDYLRESAALQQRYVEGVVDGLLMAPAVAGDGEESQYEWLTVCLIGRTGSQLTAMVDRHLELHPDRWHSPMSFLVYQTIITACPRPGAA